MVNIQETPSNVNQTANKQVTSEGKKQSNGVPDPIMLAYLYMIQALQIGSSNALIQEKQAQQAASAQNELIQDQKGDNFITFHNGKIAIGSTHADVKKGNIVVSEIVSATEIADLRASGFSVTNIRRVYQYLAVNTQVLDSLMNKNEETQALRGIIGNQIGIITQNASMIATNVNAAVDTTQQNTQEAISVMQMLNSLSNYITRM